MLELRHVLLVPFRFDVLQQVFPRVHKVAHVAPPRGQWSVLRARENVSDTSVIQGHSSQQELILQLLVVRLLFLQYIG